MSVAVKSKDDEVLERIRKMSVQNPKYCTVKEVRGIKEYGLAVPLSKLLESAMAEIVVTKGSFIWQDVIVLEGSNARIVNVVEEDGDVLHCSEYVMPIEDACEFIRNNIDMSRLKPLAYKVCRLG
ncbi:MAG: hypothetical protein JHC33_05780 [Ignisphaera sp.]|nr:hypothetical protein [Ignisphaera sp.]